MMLMEKNFLKVEFESLYHTLKNEIEKNSESDLVFSIIYEMFLKIKENPDKKNFDFEIEAILNSFNDRIKYVYGNMNTPNGEKSC
jgi:hypothetical protein